MVQYQTNSKDGQSALDRTFAALSDPTRRAILDRLRDGEATISELALASQMSLTGVKKHVAILEEAGLIASEKRGRTRYVRFGPRQLDDISEYIESYKRSWAERYDRLDQVLARRKAEIETKSTGRTGS